MTITDGCDISEWHSYYLWLWACCSFNAFKSGRNASDDVHQLVEECAFALDWALAASTDLDVSFVSVNSCNAFACVATTDKHCGFIAYSQSVAINHLKVRWDVGLTIDRTVVFTLWRDSRTPLRAWRNVEELVEAGKVTLTRSSNHGTPFTREPGSETMKPFPFDRYRNAQTRWFASSG